MILTILNPYHHYNPFYDPFLNIWVMQILNYFFNYFGLKKHTFCEMLGDNFNEKCLTTYIELY